MAKPASSRSTCRRCAPKIFRGYPSKEQPDNLRRIAMICAMEEDPPGLVPWMIVRTHDYSTEQTNATGSLHRLHWQKGMFLESRAARRSHAGKTRARISHLRPGGFGRSIL